MRTLIVHQPISLGHVIEDVKALVIEKNIAILLGNDFPCTPFLSVCDLIGDPNYSLSEHVCELLFEEGVLTRTPVLDEQGRQCKIKLETENLLWNYAWATKTLTLLSEEKLSVIAWDLRNNHNFVHITEVNEEPDVVINQPETSLDNKDSNEYDVTQTNTSD